MSDITKSNSMLKTPNNNLPYSEYGNLLVTLMVLHQKNFAKGVNDESNTAAIVHLFQLLSPEERKAICFQLVNNVLKQVELPT